ncbi:MAG TPA: N-formylglutamate amidohydrolase [Myxococcota bacterium]
MTTSTYTLHPPLSPLVRSTTDGSLAATTLAGALDADLLNPVVLSVPHAGTAVPDADLPLLNIGGQALLKDADLHVEKLAQHVPSLGVPVLEALVSRYVLDVNRAPDDVDREVCPELVRAARPSARGLCWRTTTDGVAVLKRPLTLQELDRRRATIHAAYHDALAAELERRRRKFGFAILIDLHSMPSLGRLLHVDPGARRADIVPGDVRGTSCGPALSKLVVEHFARGGFSVRANDPYMGGYVTRHHGRPGRGIHAIQIEVNRDLYMDESSFSFLPEKAAHLIEVIMGVVGAARSLDPRS